MTEEAEEEKDNDHFGLKVFAATAAIVAAIATLGLALQKAQTVQAMEEAAQYKATIARCGCK